MRQAAWFVFQISIIAAVTAFCVWVIFPTMPEPVGLHVPMILGAILALGATYAIIDLSSVWKRWRSRHRDR